MRKWPLSQGMFKGGFSKPPYTPNLLDIDIPLVNSLYVASMLMLFYHFINDCAHSFFLFTDRFKSFCGWYL